MKRSVRVFLLLLPACISLLVLAAHFLRSASIVPTAIYVFLMFGLFMYKPLSARLVQIALFLGTIEWIWTTITLSAQRSAMGAPATRMMIILLSVAAVCLISIFLFNTRTLRERFDLDRAGKSDSGETGAVDP